MRFPIDAREAAEAKLMEYRCRYTTNGVLNDVTEFALCQCKCDENGEFVSGSDYSLAPEEE